ncbi:sporulation protein YqfC [Maledivibacter halophilus]|uniref:Sporulation protein YqfC n=1 Tax=Maledivibacter halophilus TaxID=36842 RepID=A0A1T5LUD0_9FIRM|nr:sporulation protein YqfC [Maledivibacter halophilus]SKC79602.1 sporulation protein YqfC [Maledivibacter halophilus]
MKEDKIYNIKEKMSNILEIPKDILLDLPRITFVGNLLMSIENHKGIIEYSSEYIRIGIKDGTIKLSGIDLMIKTITAEEIIVSGKIVSIDFFK